MSKRKGEVTGSRIDRYWPHQVALPEHRYTGHQYRTIHYFIDREAPSVSPRGHVFARDGVWHHVFCFGEIEHAENFQRRFGGEWIDPKTRPRWPGARGK